MVKGKYQQQGCKSFIIISLLTSNLKCSLLIYEDVIKTYFEQNDMLSFHLNSSIANKRQSCKALLKVLKSKPKCLQDTVI